MGTKLVKEEGKTDKCPGCGDTIHCVLKPASGQYEARLQWQNPDGTAHYGAPPTFGCKRASGAVRTENIVNPSTTQQLPSIKDVLNTCVKIHRETYLAAEIRAREITANTNATEHDIRICACGITHDLINLIAHRISLQ